MLLKIEGGGGHGSYFGLTNKMKGKPLLVTVLHELLKVWIMQERLEIE